MDGFGPLLQRIEAKQDEILGKLNTLLKALAEEEDEEPSSTLDGQPAGRGRDQTQSLG